MSEQLDVLTVDLGSRSYPIYIGQNLLEEPGLYSRHISGNQVLVVSNETVTTGIRRACNRLTVGPGVVVDGGPVSFEARDSVVIVDTFSVTQGTVLRVIVSRTAGIPI